MDCGLKQALRDAEWTVDKTKGLCNAEWTVKGKVFYGQKPPCGESTNTEYGVNYQLLAVMY